MEKKDCFLCQEGDWFLGSFYGSRFYASAKPDLDPKCDNPAHILVASFKHHNSVLLLSRREYEAFQQNASVIMNEFLRRGYGPAVTKMELHPGPHAPHPHIHLIFSSNPLWPFRKYMPRPPIEKVHFDILKADFNSILGRK